MTTSKGTVYDLDEIFERLNRDYFRRRDPQNPCSRGRRRKLTASSAITTRRTTTSRSAHRSTRRSAAIRRRIRRLSRNAPHRPPDKTRQRPPLQPHGRIQTRRTKIRILRRSRTLDRAECGKAKNEQRRESNRIDRMNKIKR